MVETPRDIELTDAGRREMDEFRRSHDTQVLTILLSDIEGSTAQQSELGNVRAAELVKAHRKILRTALEACDGREVETAGDSFLIVFAAPSEGVRFALLAQAALGSAREEAPGIPRVRMGLNQGQVVVDRHEDGPKAMDIYGIQVSTAARIMGLADGGRILCSRSVFDDARAILRRDDGAGIVWLNHGPYRLKGREDTHEVCEVAAEDDGPIGPPPGGKSGWPADLAEEELGWRPAADVVVPGTNWRLESRLGADGRGGWRGAFGEVWLAFNPADRSRQVFKFCFRRDRLPALKREARLLKRLRSQRHPNLVEVYDVTEGERPPHYLEMEYVDGPTLGQWLADDPTLTERLEVVAQVADALDTVHAAEICHRDIKPANILLTHREDGTILAKLTDFGLGAAADRELLASIEATRVAGVSGTWDYLAPEIRRGEAPSPQSDLFSLGVTLFQVVAGDVARPVTTDWQDHVPSEILREDIRRCVDGDPDRRWARAADLATALRSHDRRLRELRLEEEREQHRRQARRLRIVVGLVTLFTVVTLGFGGFATNLWIEARAQRDRAERSREEADAQRLEARHQLGAAYVERSRALADLGRPVAAWFTAMRALDDAEGPPLLREGSETWLRARGILLANPLPLLWETPSANHHTTVVTSVACDPLGRTYASGGWASTALLWDAATGDLVVAIPNLSATVTAVSYRADGRLLGIATTSGRVHLVDPGSGGAVAAIDGPKGGVESVVFAARGTRLVLRGRDGSVEVWDTEPLARLARWELAPNDARGVAISPDGETCVAIRPPGTLVSMRVGEPSPVPVGPSADATTVVWSPDGTVLALAGAAGEVRIVTPDLSGPVERWSPGAGPVTALAFDGEGGRIATGHAGGGIRIRNRGAGETVVPETDHFLRVTSVAFSPDGSALLTGSEDGSVRRFATGDGRAIESPSGHAAAVTSLAVTPDGTVVASGSEDGTIRLRRASTGRETAILRGHGNWVHGIDISTDGRWLASGSADGTARVWDLATGRTIASYADAQGSVLAVQFDRDGNRLAWGGIDGTVRIADLATGAVRALDGIPGDIWTLRFDAEGGRIAAGGDGEFIHILDVRSGKQVAALRGHSGWLRALRYSPDGRLLASAGTDSVAILRDTESGTEIRRLGGEGGWIHGLAFSPDGAFLATANMDRTVRIFSTTTGREISRLEGEPDWVDAVEFSPDGRTLFSGGDAGTVRAWDVSVLRPAGGLTGHTGWVGGIAFGPGDEIYSGSWDRTVRIWDATLGRPAAVLAGHQDPVSAVACRPQGGLVASGSWDRTVRLWDPVSGREVEVLGPFDNAVWSLSFAPDGGMLAIAVGDGTVHQFDTVTRRPGPILEGHASPVMRVRFGAEGRTILSESDDGEILVREAETGEVLSRVAPTAPTRFVTAVSPDGRRIARARGTELRLSTADAPDVERVIRRASGNVMVLRFSPDGSTLATGDFDGAVRLRDGETGDPIAVFAEHGGSISCLEFDADGLRLVSGDSNGGLRIMRLSPPKSADPALADRVDWKGLEAVVGPPPQRLAGNPGIGSAAREEK